MKNKKQNISILIYYGILLLIMISRKDATSEPPMVLRLAFLGAVTIPAVLLKNVSYPAIITLFYTLATQGFAYSYMPYMKNIYVIITLLVAFYILSKKNISQKIPKYLIFFTFYILSIDLITSVNDDGSKVFQNTFYNFFLIILFLVIIDKHKDNTLSLLQLSFSIISIILSYLFLTNREQFIHDELIGGMERSGWIDPNYFGTIIGMGTTVSLLKLFDENWKKENLFLKIICITVITLSIPTLLLNASRGAMLSVISAFIAISFLSKIKLWHKVVIVIVCAIMIIYLYTNEYFDLLLYRLENDSGTGSGRTDIWQSKLQAFSQGNILRIIFGHGYHGGMNIAGYYVGFHNDYIGFLVEYGIIGLCLFLYMLYYPIRKSFKNGKIQPDVVAIILYIAICSMTIEPFGLGVLPFYSFYMYALLLSNNKNS